MAQLPTSKDLKKLDAIDELLDEGELEEALVEAVALTRKRPKLVEAWQTLMEIAQIMGDNFTMWKAARQLTELEPEEDNHLYNLIITSARESAQYYTRQQVERYLKRFPDGMYVDQMQELKAHLDQFAQEEVESGQFDHDADLEAAALMDLGRILITHGYGTEGRKYALQASKRLPGNAVPLNNLSLSYIVDGNLTKALQIIDQALETQPDNLFSTALRIQTLVRLGREDEARKQMDRLSQLQPRTGDHWYKALEACAYLHEHALLIEIYEKHRKQYDVREQPPHQKADMYHLLGTAHAFLGNDRKARTMWRKAITNGGEVTPAQENLESYRERGPWYFSVPYWVPHAWMDDINKLASRVLRRGGKIGSLYQALKRSLEKTPGFLPTLSLLWQRGGPDAIQLLLLLSSQYPIPGLLEFAQGERGTNQERIQAAQLATQHGLTPPDEPLMVRLDGELQPLMSLNFEITSEAQPRDPAVPQAAYAHMEKSHELQQQGRVEEALEETEKGLALAPDAPTLLNHKIGALMKLGREEEAMDMARQLAQQHPDYLFARTGMANLCLNDGQVEEAEEWLQPLLEREKLHISEFVAIAFGFTRLALHKRDFTTARSWMNMLAEVDPDAIPEQWEWLLDE